MAAVADTTRARAVAVVDSIVVTAERVRLLSLGSCRQPLTLLLLTGRRRSRDRQNTR